MTSIGENLQQSCIAGISKYMQENDYTLVKTVIHEGGYNYQGSVYLTFKKLFPDKLWLSEDMLLIKLTDHYSNKIYNGQNKAITFSWNIPLIKIKRVLKEYF